MQNNTQVISLRINKEIFNKLEAITKATQRNKSDLLLNWIEDGIALEEWQIKEIEASIKEADQGEFIFQEEVNRVLNKWL